MSLIRSLNYLRRVKKNQWTNIQELKKIQEKKLRSIVYYAYKNVRFYKHRFKLAGIHPYDIKTIKDLKKMPLTKKEDIRKNFPDNIVSIEYDYKKCKTWETSGSTGIPIKTVYDSKADDFAKAILIRSYLGNGLKYFDRWCVIGSPDYRREKIRGYNFYQKIGFLSPLYISVFDSIERKIDILSRFKPRLIDSLPTDLYLITKYLEENNIKNIKPEIITTNGEILDGYIRKYINDFFNVEISDLVGCFELRRTSWECPYHEGYHIDIDSIVMEFLRDNEDVSPGEEGKIVYTGLYNHAMPLIRYDIEDIGIPSDHFCSCGRGLPMMKSIEGKSLDFLVTTDDKLVSPHVPKELLMRIPGIYMFKLIQFSKYKVKILIVKGIKYTAKSTQEINNILKEILGEDVKVDIEFVESIQRNSRKYKVIECKIPFRDKSVKI